MDDEPGRCRRTDGRKWRCRKNVVPLQKYCEKHMHRGCRGSRKLVESQPIQAASLKYDNKFNRGIGKCMKSLDNWDSSPGVDERKGCLNSDTGSHGCEKLNVSSIASKVHSIVHVPYTASSLKDSGSDIGYSVEGMLVSLRQGRCHRRDRKSWQGKRSRLVLEESAIISPASLDIMATGINLNSAPSSSHGRNSCGSTSESTTITDESISLLK